MIKVPKCRACHVSLNDDNWHTSLKYYNDCICKKCKIKNSQIWRKQNKKKHAKNRLNWLAKNEGHLQKWQSKYYQENKERYFEYGRKYRKKPEGQRSQRKMQAKRRNNLGYEELFPNLKVCILTDDNDIEYHHVNQIFVLPIATRLHRATLGEFHREIINQLILENAGIDINEMICISANENVRTRSSA